MTEKPQPKLHPGHHWGPFAKDPWSPDLDPVVGEVWERAARSGRVGVKQPAATAAPAPTDPTSPNQPPPHKYPEDSASPRHPVRPPDAPRHKAK